MVLIWWKYEIQKPKNTDEIYWLQGAPRRIRKAEDKINKMSNEEFCDEMVKFGTEAKKAGGVVNLVFRDIQWI